MMNDWITEFPTEEGWWWFWGHRYGLNENGNLESDPELYAVRVIALSKGFMYIADGQFMYESEVLYPHFKKMDVPTDLPEIKYV
jgi:hypothetical protein